MKRSWLVTLALLLVIPGLLLTVSCAKKTVKSEEVLSQEAVEDIARLAAEREAEKTKQLATAKEQERRRAIEEQRLRDEAAKREDEKAARHRFENRDIHFEFDKSSLLPDAQDILKEKAQWLRANLRANVLIEGHCDERGTAEYNIALGERRAESAKRFLINLGIDASRLETISYGKEKPLDPGQNEIAWAKNRRAHFVIK